MRDPEIGYRAFQAVKAQADRRGVSINREADRLGIHIQTVYKWRDGSAPSSAWLQLLHQAGYDVLWILTGGDQREG